MMASPNSPQSGIASGSPSPDRQMPGAPVNVQALEGTRQRYSGFELWLHRITMLMFVFVCASVGVLLIILPWRPEWTDNHFLTGAPALRELAGSGFVRGVCSGLGLMDVWISFWEAIHYHEEKRG